MERTRRGEGEELVAVGAVVAVRGHNFRLLLSPADSL
jgi:hypothetical protein